MKQQNFSKVQVEHMTQAAKSGDVERLNKQTQVLKELAKLQRQGALELIRIQTI